MNEVLAVLYFCFLEETELVGEKYRESSLFFSFTNLMTEMKDGFLREMDKDKGGLQSRIKHYTEVMKAVEPHAYRAISENQINP